MCAKNVSPTVLQVRFFFALLRLGPLAWLFVVLVVFGVTSCMEPTNFHPLIFGQDHLAFVLIMASETHKNV